LSHLVLFAFAYPDRRADIPARVLDDLTRRFWKLRQKDGEHVCYGTLLSREQYLYDVRVLGYEDARLQPRGNMTTAEEEIWTESITHK
jgi:hypothetical protein